MADTNLDQTLILEHAYALGVESSVPMNHNGSTAGVDDDVLLGGDGGDVILGASGRDRLIGGFCDSEISVAQATFDVQSDRDATDLAIEAIFADSLLESLAVKTIT